MSRKTSLITALGIAMFLPACGEKSEAEKADEERVGLRDEKRKKAIEFYKSVAEQYPDDPKAADARQKAAALEVMASKK